MSEQDSRDPGLQSERTSLSWMRFNLSVLAACLGLTKLFFDVNLWLALTSGIVGIALSVLLAVVLTARYPRALTGMHKPAKMPDGKLLGMAALALVFISAMSAVFFSTCPL